MLWNNSILKPKLYMSAKTKKEHLVLKLAKVKKGREKGMESTVLVERW